MRAGGEDQRRLDVLSAWHEAPSLFSEPNSVHVIYVAITPKAR